jgi:hypothetical protein
VTDFVEQGWVFAVGMEKNSAGDFLRIAIDEDADIPLAGQWTGTNVNDPYRGVPSLAALFERGKIILPYADVPSRRASDILVDEFHSLGTAAHDDIVAAVWIAEVLLRRALGAYDAFIDEMEPEDEDEAA